VGFNPKRIQEYYVEVVREGEKEGRIEGFFFIWWVKEYTTQFNPAKILYMLAKEQE
jgi:hypothetical protein